MPFFGSLFKSKDGSKPSKTRNQTEAAPAPVSKNPPWQESWDRTEVGTEEISELIHLATQEIKARDLDAPFFLLPFRPDSDASSTSSARNFVCQYFKAKYAGNGAYSGDRLSHELLLTEPLVLCSIIKWCWSRLPGGVVTWDTYEMFRTGEQDSNMALHSFDTFIPLSADNKARKQIIFDFFDLLAAISARGKTNGLGGRKLSRLGGWWAFELNDGGKGFDGGYASWSNAANACSHLFFAYLRSLSPESQPGLSGISPLPRSLQALLSQTEYPPQAPTLMQSTTSKVVMIVDSVSPTPFALLRRTKHFEYRDDDRVLQEFSTFEDPVRALTDECRRVLEAISSANQSADKTIDSTWSRFQSSGFGQVTDSPAKSTNGAPLQGTSDFQPLRTDPGSRKNDFGRPTTPSWADFLTTGFSEDSTQRGGGPVLLPPDKQLPPIGETARVHSSQSHVNNNNNNNNSFTDLEPGELASIGRFELDDTFWWVWITSLAGEETALRKAVFGRCALIEVEIAGAKWLLVEEQIKGASPRPDKDLYIAEKKSKFSFSRRGRLGRRKSVGKKPHEPYNRIANDTSMSKTSISPDQQTAIKKAAAKLAREQKEKKAMADGVQRRGRNDETQSTKTNSVLTLQPLIMSEAAPAMKWAKEFDKDNVRAKYLSSSDAGTGKPVEGLADTQRETQLNGRTTPEPLATKRDDSSLRSPSTPISVQRKAIASPSPSSFVTPVKAEPSSKDEVTHASKIPLPKEPTPLPSPQPDMSQHPAYRSDSIGEEAAPALPEKDDTNEGYRAVQENATPVEPESPSVPKKDSPKKLRKGRESGFKRMFTKSKKEPELAQKSQTVPQPPSKGPVLPAPPPKIEERPSDVSAAPQEPEHQIEQPVEETPSVVASSPTIPQSAAVDAVANDRTIDSTTHSSAFNQGPLEDVPAFVPEDSPPAPQDEFPKSETVPPPAQEIMVSPVEKQSPPTAVDNQSEQSLELTKETSPSQDRWAQIRKNAADRAARLSEEQKSQTQRTDEGDTSGEETIEHRVARIKARVAELTGQIDAQGNLPLKKR